MKIRKQQAPRTIFAVIADEVSVELNRIDFPLKPTEWDSETTHEMISLLASVNNAWFDVLSGNRVAVIFDAETGEKLRINCNPSRRLHV
ncbi:hypothetical protein LJC34_01955 [Oscillospiraceae bacterium OttesenSCG-928-G22]|nr:hypothetical protein [Oscillospiraceae bacterium OttesenSCG-928-G22]